MASPGDWPWHVALFKDGVHICDATLISKDWLLTTVFCFQGYVHIKYYIQIRTINIPTSRKNNLIPSEKYLDII